jgi:tannase
MNLFQLIYNTLVPAVIACYHQRPRCGYHFLIQNLVYSLLKMHPSSLKWMLVHMFAIAYAAPSLVDVCTIEYVEAHLPQSDVYPGILISSSSISANPVYDVEVVDSTFFPNAVFDYCNVTFSYTHVGLNDSVVLTYWLPTPAKFQNRYLSTGGGGYAINSGNMSLPGGIIYGAVAGETDGGFGIYQNAAINTFLVANGTRNWHNIYMFGYEAIHEMGEIGKAFTKTFFNISETTKLYSYYQGCSEGGREGWSQVQRFADEFDGAAIGAPAFRFAFQQVQHLYSNVVEQTLNYFPSPCMYSMNCPVPMSRSSTICPCFLRKKI